MNKVFINSTEIGCTDQIPLIEYETQDFYGIYGMQSIVTHRKNQPISVSLNKNYRRCPDKFDMVIKCNTSEYQLLNCYIVQRLFVNHDTLLIGYENFR